MRYNRRKFLGAVGMMLAVPNEGCVKEGARSTADIARPPAGPSPKMDLGELAANRYHNDGRSCAEAMLSAGLEYLGEPKELIRMASPFGGGMHMGDHCGFFCAGLMTIGLACAGRDDGKPLAVKLTKTFTQAWKKQRPLRCREIKKLQKVGTLKGGCKQLGKEAGRSLAELLDPIVNGPKRAHFTRQS